jgi:hypothetical protein
MLLRRKSLGKTEQYPCLANAFEYACAARYQSPVTVPRAFHNLGSKQRESERADEELL